VYKNVQLASRGALQLTNLEGLGQIVVVCGKNNSGKSTVLQAIQQGTQYLKPSELNTRDFEECVRFTDGSKWDKTAEIVQVVPSYKDYWTEKDAEEFVNMLYHQEIKNKWSFHGRQLADTQNEIRSTYRDHLKPHKLITIPPKRVLELQNSIQTSASVLPHGEGLLNFLFRAFNQQEKASDYKMYEKIRTAFQSISDGYDFKITVGTQNDVNLNFRRDNSEWFSAHDCGLGLQDLLILLYFIVSPDYNILLIEEPESHLHPAMQRKLLEFCKKAKNKQFFFSTHSSVFLDLTLVDTILHTEMTEEGIEVSNDTSRAAVLDSLGYSITDNLVSDLIILVEGPKDKPVIEEFLQKMGLYSSYSIKIWPLGGDIMDQLDLTVFSEKYKIIALIDTDPKSRKVRSRFKTNCRTLKVDVHQLKYRAIENYFTLDALRGVFGNQVPKHLTTIETDELLEKQIGFNVKMKNYNIAKLMTVEDIKNTDLYGFLEKVRKKLES
jgi:predicted ATP-dependent endonuclease of OLD family